MQTRTIGGIAVSAIGLGAMPMSQPDPVDRDRALATIHAALDAGVTLIDTADVYAPGPDAIGHNEVLVAEALAAWSGDADAVLVATKGGMTRAEGDADWGTDGRPEHLRAACEASLRRLGVEAIGLYQHHRPDPDVPYAETMGALAELHAEGKIRLVGISNANEAQIREARAIAPVVAVQNEHSPAFRSSAGELALCAELGVAFLPWSPLGGMGDAGALGSKHFAFAAIAEERGVSAQQVALAWALAQSPTVIPIPGSSRPETILDSVAAADLALTPDELSRLDEG
jgi:aryl-alcohol dehydrogenase-like predicted oxidoreductase